MINTTSKLASFCAFLSPPAPSLRIHWPLTTVSTTVLPPHASRSTPIAGSRARPSPAGYCLPPTAQLQKTERGPISTSGPLSLVCHRTRRFFRTKSNLLLPARRRPPVDRSLVAAGAQRQWFQACLPGGHKPQCCSLLALPVCRNSPERSGVVSTGLSITTKGGSNRGSAKRTARTLRLFPSRCLHGASSLAKLHSCRGQRRPSRRRNMADLAVSTSTINGLFRRWKPKRRGACKLLDVPERAV